MAIKGKALLDAATGKLLSTHLPPAPTFDDVQLTNGTSLIHGSIAMASSVDLMSMGSSNLLVVPSGQIAIVTGALFLMNNASSISGTVEIGIGTDVVAENILPSSAMTGFNTGGQAYYRAVSGVFSTAMPTEVIKVGIDVAFSGTSADMMVLLLGMLVPI